MYTTLLNFFYPPSCSICGAESPSEALCNQCKEELQCQMPYLYIDEDDLFYERWGLYDFNKVQGPVHNLKYHRVFHGARSIAITAKEHENLSHLLKTVDCITWVPLHWIRFIRRGYNQAKVLADELCENSTQLERALIRQRYTTSQTKFSRESRSANMESVFRVNPTCDILGKRILLVDDVVTTGATAKACARALYEGGACEVSLVTLAQA